LNGDNNLVVFFRASGRAYRLTLSSRKQMLSSQHRSSNYL